MGEREGHIFIFSSMITLLLWFSQAFSECLQFKGMENKLSYFTTIWNWLYIAGLVSVLLITLITLGTELSLAPESYFFSFAFVWAANLLSYETLRILAAGASFCLLVEFFDWLRLFERTAFYIMLLVETLSDITGFVILIVASLMLFGVPMAMLNLNRDESSQVVEPTFGNWAANMILNQYFLALGEFNYENFADKPQGLICYFLFLAATFFTQITMLNMLIAIMGESFARVYENRDVSATRTKLNFMHDMAGTVGKQSKEEEKDVFMYIVMPQETEMLSEEGWEGSVSRITTLVKAEIDSLKQELNWKIERLQSNQDEFVRVDKAMDRHMKQQIQNSEQQVHKRIDKSDRHMNSRLDGMETKLDKMHTIINSLGKAMQFKDF